MSEYSKSQISALLETYVSDNWTHTQIAWENTAFKTPLTDPWIRASVLFDDDQNVGIGPNCIQVSGNVLIEIFTRYDTGTGKSMELADYAETMLQNKTIEGLVTYASSVRKIGDASRQMNRIESDWYTVHVLAPFETAR